MVEINENFNDFLFASILSAGKLVIIIKNMGIFADFNHFKIYSHHTFFPVMLLLFDHNF